MKKDKILEICNNVIYSKQALLSGVGDSWSGLKTTINFHTRSTPSMPMFEKIYEHDKSKTPEELKRKFEEDVKLYDSFGFSEKKPISLEEASKKRSLPPSEELEKIKFDCISEHLYNKKIQIEDFTIHIQHSYEKSLTDRYSRRNSNSDFFKEIKQYEKKSQPPLCKCVHKDEWNIILEYHGYFVNIGNVTLEDTSKFYYAMNKNQYDFWFGGSEIAKNLSDVTPCIMEDYEREVTYKEFLECTLELIKLLNEITTELSDGDLDFQYKYIYDDMKVNKIENLQNIDYLFLVTKQTKDGVYSPTKAVIDRFFGYRRFNDKKLIDKTILKKAGVHTVQFKDSVHFNILEYFSLKDIKIKAPKKVIERYNYSKYCEDKTIVEKIKEEEEEEKLREELEIKADTYTLMQNGKVVLKDKRSYEIAEYFDKKTSLSLKKDAINAMTSVFEANPTIDKIELASFGTYYKYELAGETHYNTDCLNKHIDKDLFNNICELYDFYLPSEEDLEVTFGWPERGFQVFGVRRKPKSKKLEAYVEDYDGVE